MKVSVPKETGYETKANALLPLEEDPELYKLDKTNSVQWELRSTPADANSPSHWCQVRVLQGTETPRQMSRWQIDVEKVVAGLNTTTKDAQRPLMEACMRSGPKAIFGAAIDYMAQNLFDQGLPAALATDVKNGNNLAETAYRAAGVKGHISVDVL